MIEDIRETRLENGLVVLTDRMPGVRSVTLGFFFRVGARHEPRHLNGISHFIEHGVFKGTSKRSALEIAIEQDRLGGNLDAFTTHEETGFAIKVIDEQLPQAFDLISDMLMNPSFDEADLKSEQRVIIEELKMIEDSPEEYLGEIFSAAFFPGHPLGTNIAGTPKTVRSFDHATTRTFHTEHYTPQNLVIVAAGNVEHDDIVKLVLSTNFSWPTTEKGLLKQGLKTTAPNLAAPIIVKNQANLEQAHLTIATPFVSAPEQRRYAADLLANIIGGSSSSRLWQKIREERGLAYNVGASSAMYQDTGVFSMFGATSPERVAEVVELSIAELRDIVKSGITQQELELAKQTSRASILLSLEDSAARAAALAQFEMVHGRQISVEETLASVDAVTVDDCNAIATEFFQTESVAFAVLGDLKSLKMDREQLSI
jgi:predicted Zn-dependent peptidase